MSRKYIIIIIIQAQSIQVASKTNLHSFWDWFRDQYVMPLHVVRSILFRMLVAKTLLKIFCLICVWKDVKVKNETDFFSKQFVANRKCWRQRPYLHSLRSMRSWTLCWVFETRDLARSSCFTFSETPSAREAVLHTSFAMASAEAAKKIRIYFSCKCHLA